ncbi:phospholipase [Paenibacillus sp. XY044]|nr:phospholipase [Paenibacillus sp. XY044]
MSQSVKRLDKEMTKRVQLDYLLHLPEAYESEPEKEWPLILFLHGAGERGNDVELVKVHGIPKIAEQDPAFPFIAVSPQCPEDFFWAMEEDALMALLDDVQHQYRVDPKRVYLTGLSMGGYGSWHLAAMYPGKWAAVVPICGGLEPKYAKQIKDIPIWAFHGAKDDVVPLSESEQIVKALEEIGGNVKFTVYPDANHNSWTETYANKELYAWLLSHSLS